MGPTTEKKTTPPITIFESVDGLPSVFFSPARTHLSCLAAICAMTLGEKIPIWLDCDTGNDDTFAILLGALHPLFELVGVSTVFGNAPLACTTHNTLAILQMLGRRDVPVYAGADKPLEVAPHYATHIHGDTGLTGVVVPKDLQLYEATDRTYLEAMALAVECHAGALSFVCTGALTNMANFVTQYPHLRGRVRFVSIMGGAIDTGNVTPYLEFNCYCDPHAALLVLSDRVLCDKCILVTLNLTHRAIATSEVCAAIYNSAKNSPLRKVFLSIIEYFGRNYERQQGFEDGPPMHDPLAMFVLFAMVSQSQGGDDFGLQYRRGHISVVHLGKHQGQTVLAPADSGVYIPTAIDFAQFWDAVLTALDVSDRA